MLSLLLLSFWGCMSDSQLKEKLTKIIKDNPDIVVASIKANPIAYIEGFKEAARTAQKEMAEKKKRAEGEKIKAFYENPLKPVIRKDELIRGNKNAPLTLVEYSDFECPYCSRGYDTMVQLLQKYGDKIRFVYKHLPLSFHKHAMLAAQYYEAIRLQSEEKAIKFHDEIFKNQSSLQKGESFLNQIAKKIGVNMKKLKKDYKLESVQARINEDMEEAKKLGVNGTPGFLMNGIPGAYSVDQFDKIIEKLKKKGLVDL